MSPICQDSLLFLLARWHEGDSLASHSIKIAFTGFVCCLDNFDDYYASPFRNDTVSVSSKACLFVSLFMALFLAVFMAVESDWLSGSLAHSIDSDWLAVRKRLSR